MKMIVAALFTMFVAAAATADTGSQTNVYDPICSPAYTACTDSCKEDFSGGALGACLRLCRAEYNECLASH